jgi:hypothetical protein
LTKACEQVAQSIAEKEPDLIVLMAPHHVSVPGKVGVYVAGPHSQATGNSEWNQRWTEVCFFALSFLLLHSHS